MRAGGDDAAHLEAARLRLVDKEEDQCNRGCQRGARAAATTAADSATAARGTLFRRAPFGWTRCRAGASGHSASSRARGPSALRRAEAAQRPPPGPPQLQLMQTLRGVAQIHLRSLRSFDRPARSRLLCLSISQRCFRTGDGIARAPEGSGSYELHRRLVPRAGFVGRSRIHLPRT